MKKLIACVGILVLLLTAIAPPVPVKAQPHVFIGTVMMRAEGDISFFSSSATVRKAIMLRNAGDEPATISLSASDIEVSFEENDFELAADNEKRIVYALVKVEEGTHQGTIHVKILSGGGPEGIGSKATGGLGISVITVGTKASLPLTLIIPIGVVVIGGIGFGVFWRRRAKQKPA